jgi:hypothetical protein
MDTIDFGKVFAFTAVDIFSREADVYLAPALTSAEGTNFLVRCLLLRFTHASVSTRALLPSFRPMAAPSLKARSPKAWERYAFVIESRVATKRTNKITMSRSTARYGGSV